MAAQTCQVSINESRLFFTEKTPAGFQTLPGFVLGNSKALSTNTFIF
jgi:hypothetical protein